jgi:hypothetical protein
MEPENNSTKNDWIKNRLTIVVLVSIIVFFSGLYFFTLKTVPFHPDESTQIYMSGDLKSYLQSPLSLAWQPENSNDPKMIYRLLDAPFARNWIGVFLSITGYQPLPVDWNWSASWQANTVLGALPSPGLLFLSRLASAIFFPFDLIFLFLIGRKLSGNRLGWMVMMLFAVNALILLHTRRAMSEGSLVFFIILALWVFLQNPKILYLAAIPVALAFNSKYSALPLLFLGIFVIILRNWQPHLPYKRMILHIFFFLLIFFSITWLMNPFLWKYPIASLTASFLARQDLLTRQATEIGNLVPGWLLDTPSKRVLGTIANLFITSLAYHDVGNYLQNTLISEIKYTQLSVNVLLRGYLGGGIMFLLSIAGFVFGGMDCRKLHGERVQLLLIMIAGTILEFLFLVFAFTLPFQRYVLPLVPFVIIWIAYSIDWLVQSIQGNKNRAV